MHGKATFTNKKERREETTAKRITNTRAAQAANSPFATLPFRIPLWGYDKKLKLQALRKKQSFQFLNNKLFSEAYISKSVAVDFSAVLPWCLQSRQRPPKHKKKTLPRYFFLHLPLLHCPDIKSTAV